MTMLKFRALLFAFLYLVLASVPSAALAAKKPGVLRPTQATGSFVLAQDAEFTIRLGIGVKWRWGLHAGTFKPAFEDDEGVFYEGVDWPVICFMEKRSMGDYAGGIFVPKADPSHPWLYYYFKRDESTYRNGGPIVAWMIKSGEGKINFFPYRGPLQDEAFLKTLQAAYSPDAPADPTAAGTQ